MPNNIRQQGAFFTTGDPETVSDKVMYAPGMLGVEVTIKEPGPSGTALTGGVGAGGAASPSGYGAGYRFKTYKYVQSDSSMTVPPFKGAVAWWASKERYLVTTTVGTLGRGRVAGIFENDESGTIDGKGANPIVPGNFCWIQTEGPGLVKFVDAPTAAPTAAGLIVIPSATAGKADCLAAGTAATYPAIGVSASNYAAVQAGNTLALVDIEIVPRTP